MEIVGAKRNFVLILLARPSRLPLYINCMGVYSRRNRSRGLIAKKSLTRQYPSGSGSSQYRLQETSSTLLDYLGGAGRFLDYDRPAVAAIINPTTGKRGLPNQWIVNSFSGSNFAEYPSNPDGQLIEVLHDRALEVPTSNASLYSLPIRVRQDITRQTKLDLITYFRLYRKQSLKLRGWIKLDKLADKSFNVGSGIIFQVYLDTDQFPFTWARKTLKVNNIAMFLGTSLKNWAYFETDAFSLDSSTDAERNVNFDRTQGDYWRGAIDINGQPNDPQFSWSAIGGRWKEARLQIEIGSGFEGVIFFNHLELVEASAVPIVIPSAQSSTYPYVKEIAPYWYNDPAYIVGGGEIFALPALQTPCIGGESFYTGVSYVVGTNPKHPRQAGWLPVDVNDKAQCFYSDNNRSELRLHPSKPVMMSVPKLEGGTNDFYHQAESNHTGNWFDLLKRSGSRSGFDNWYALSLFGREKDYHYFGTTPTYNKLSGDPTPDFPFPLNELGSDGQPVMKDHWKMYKRSGAGTTNDPYLYALRVDSSNFYHLNPGNDELLSFVCSRVGAYLSAMGIKHCKFDCGEWNAPTENGSFYWVRDTANGAWIELTTAVWRARMWKHIRVLAQSLFDNFGILSCINLAASTILDGSPGEANFTATETLRADGTYTGGGGNLIDVLEGVMYEVAFISGYVESGTGNLKRSYTDIHSWWKMIESANRSANGGMAKIQYGLHVVGTTKADIMETLCYGMASVLIASTYAWENVYTWCSQGIRNPTTGRFEGELEFKMPIESWDLGFPKSPYTWIGPTKDAQNRYTGGIARGEFTNGIVLVRPPKNSNNLTDGGGAVPSVNVVLNEPRDMINLETGASVLKNATISVPSGKAFILQYV